MSTRLVLADHHPIVMDGLQALLSTESGYEVVARCTTSDAALKAVRAHRPNIAILDMHMPENGGMDVLRAIRHEALNCRVVLLAGSVDDEEALTAVRLGVDGILLKELASQLILECIRKVSAGERWLEKRSTSRVIEALIRKESGARDLARTLTPREIELARLAGIGLRNKEIARRLRIREGTVKIHLHNIYDKLGIDSRVQLVLYAQSKGLV